MEGTKLLCYPIQAKKNQTRQQAKIQNLTEEDMWIRVHRIEMSWLK